MFRLFLSGIILVTFLMSCNGFPFTSGDTTEPLTVSLDEPFTLAPGQTARVPSVPISMTFIDVPSDSRCPTGAQCVWAGEVHVKLRIVFDNQSPEEIILILGPDSERKKKRFSTYDLELIKVEPYPRINETIPSSAYRATLVLHSNQS